MRPKAIIFDWGDVLSKSRVGTLLKEISEQFSVPQNNILRAYLSAAPAYERGEVSSSEFVRNFLTCLDGPKQIDPALVLDLPVRAWSQPDPEMLALVKGLRPRYKTALLSNNIREVAREIRARIDLESLFDVVVFSNETGMRKPEPGIYRLCLDRLAAAPGDAVFIDNHQSLCEGAEAVGMRAILFTGRRQLLTDLAGLGVAVELPRL